jgi:hypothetical protein
MGGSVGLVGPAVPEIAVDQERRAIEVTRAVAGVLAGLRELHIVDQRLAGGQRAVRELDRQDRGIASPVIDVVLARVGLGVLP